MLRNPPSTFYPINFYNITKLKNSWEKSVELTVTEVASTAKQTEIQHIGKRERERERESHHIIVLLPDMTPSANLAESMGSRLNWRQYRLIRPCLEVKNAMLKATSRHIVTDAP